VGALAAPVWARYAHLPRPSPLIAVALR
jgi:hypothetical protein